MNARKKIEAIRALIHKGKLGAALAEYHKVVGGTSEATLATVLLIWHQRVVGDLEFHGISYSDYNI